MKFYYKNELSRTSKTRNYTHAAITYLNNGELVLLGCATSFDLAQKAAVSQTSTKRANLKYYKAELDAINENKQDFYLGNRKFKVEYPKEKLEEWIKNSENYLNRIEIVKLEAKM